MDFLNDTKLCTGCGACANICSHGAIVMKENEKGFLKPVIDVAKCKHCGLCEKICPVINFKSENFASLKVFAFINQKENERMISSSGGVFPVFADYILKQGGIVFGAVYDSEMKVCHTSADNSNQIKKMQGSKYVQSDTKYTYRETKSALESGRYVLYTGTPCQIAGLKSYLRHDYENLLTIDLICHGVPSRKVFEMYKKELLEENKDSGKILEINMRDKNYGWGYKSTETVKTTNSTYHTSADNNVYHNVFLSNLSINDSCLGCKFNKIPRTGDITMGDFWGVDDFDGIVNDQKGVSVVLLNSSKGKEYFERINSLQSVFAKELPLDFVIKYNTNLVASSKPHRKREKFFKDVIKGKKTLRALKKKYLTPKKRILKRLFKTIGELLKKTVKKVLSV